MKTQMGVFIIKNNKNNMVYVDVSTDIEKILNRYKFELRMGSSRIKEMQKDWTNYGEQAFSFEVLDTIKRDENNENRNYSEDLKTLKMLCMDKLKENEAIGFYNK